MDPYQQNDPNLRKSRGYLPPSTTPAQQMNRDEEARHELGTKAGDNPDPYLANDPELQQRYNQDASYQTVPAEGQHDYKWWEVPGAAILNTPGSAAKLVGNVAGAAWDWKHSIPALLGLAPGAAMNTLTPDVKAMVAQDLPYAPQMMASANAITEGYGQRYGGGQNILNTLATDPVGAAVDASGLAGGLGLGARGVALAADLAGAGGVATKAGEAAAALGKASDAINPLNVLNKPARAAGNLARKGFNLFDPQGNLVLGAAEGQESAILRRLRSGNEIVPGSKPTAGQAVATDLTATRFAALDKAAQKRLPTEATNIKELQNKARLDHVRTIGQTPADLEAAIVARKAATDPHYAAADATVVRADQPLLDLFDRPSMDKVFERAKAIAAERGVPFQFGTTAPATTTTTASPLFSPHGAPITSTTTTPATFAAYPGSSLHIVKQAFDDMIKDPVSFGISATEAKALMGTRNEFINWFETKNPAYRTARSEFARLSRPIDQMKIGQYLEDKLKNPTMVEDSPTLRADSFSTALKEAVTKNTNIKRATGEQRYRNLDEILDPHHMSALHAIQDDLARAKLADNHATAANKYSGVLDSAADTIQAPSLLNAPVTIINALLRGLTGHVNEKVANRVANAMLTPEGAAGILENALANKRKLDRASVPFHIGGKVIQITNKGGAGYNALALERERNNTSR